MIESVVIFLAKYLYLIITGITFLFIFFSPKKVRLQLIALVILSLVMAFIIGRILNIFIFNPRPFVEGNFTPLVSHIPNNGFPSEHTLLTGTLALCVFSFNKKLGTILLILAILVGFGRMGAGVHHFSDIIGGMLISLVAVSGIYFILKNKKFIKAAERQFLVLTK